MSVVVEPLVPEVVEPAFAVVVELVEAFFPEVVEAVVALVPEVVDGVVALVPALDRPVAEATVSAVRWVWPENDVAASAEKTPVRPAAPARPNLVRRRTRLTPASLALVLFGDISFPF